MGGYPLAGFEVTIIGRFWVTAEDVSFLNSPPESKPTILDFGNGGAITVQPSFRNGSIMPEARIYCPKLLVGQSLIVGLHTMTMNPITRNKDGSFNWPQQAVSKQQRDPKIFRVKGQFETGGADKPNRYPISYEEPLKRP
jgi:hypothetical protein